MEIEKEKLQQLVDNFYEVCNFCDEMNIYEAEELDAAMQEMLKDPEVQKKMKNIGVRPFYLDANKTVDHVNNKVKIVTKLWKLN